MGLTRGVVDNATDPRGEARLQVRIVGQPIAVWAARVFPLAAFGHADLTIGDEVWIAYENDDPALPVVLGTVDAPDRRTSLVRDREALGDAWDRGHAAGAADRATGTVDTNPYR